MLFLKKTNRRTLQDYLASTIIINVLKHNELMKITMFAEIETAMDIKRGRWIDLRLQMPVDIH
jgi:hypothetical protein